MRAYRGFWWVLGFRQPQQKALVNPAVSSPGRQNLAGRKRLRRVTRLLLSILPRWVQGALGYPVSSSIGRCLSPGIMDCFCVARVFSNGVYSSVWAVAMNLGKYLVNIVCLLTQTNLTMVS